MRTKKTDVVNPLDLFEGTFPVEINGVSFRIISPFIANYPNAIRIFAKIQANFDLKSFYEQELWGNDTEKSEPARQFASDALFKNTDKSDNAAKFQTLISYVEQHTNDALDLLSLFLVKESTYQNMVKENLKTDDIVAESKQAISLINSIPTIFALSKLVFEVNADFFMKQMQQVTTKIAELRAEKLAKTTTQ